MLTINDLTVRLGGRVLFEGANLFLPAGHKVGLVGRNGSGKTTLFRVIAGDLVPDAGMVSLAGRPRVGRVAQEAPDGPCSLLDAVLAADEERGRLLAEAETTTDPFRIAAVHTRLVDIEAHSAPARAAAILSGLGFNEAAQARPCQEFSGGWRMRVALAGALFARPDLLLLDEPTNHLDLEATLWLEGYLSAWPGTLLVISHERRLLNRVAKEIVHLSERRLTRYAGNYDRFERVRRENLVREARMRDRQIAEQKRIQAFVDRFRAKATKARQAQSRLKMLARMEPIAAVIEEHTTAFQFPAPEEMPPPLIALTGVSVGYVPDKAVLSRLNLRIDMDDRIALIGANGNGKSTLVKLLSGRLDVMGGTLHRSGKLRVGYFAQHQAEELDMDGTAFSHLAMLMPDARESVVRAHLGRFGFGQDKADVKVSSLSGGEKARLLFAMMSRANPHMLLLDEPTNHLDVDAREALVEALNAFEGAVIVVSHDAHLIDLVCDRLWLVADGTCAPFDGCLDDYARWLTEQRRAGRQGEDEATANGRKEARRSRAQARAEAAPLRRAAAQADRRLADAADRKKRLEAELAAPETYALPPDRLTRLQIALSEAQGALEAAEEAWLAAHAVLDEAE